MTSAHEPAEASRGPERFDIPAKATLIEVSRAFRAYAERVAAAKGRTLDPVWYTDRPEQAPHLYKDQPHLLKSGNSGDDHSEAR